MAQRKKKKRAARGSKTRRDVSPIAHIGIPDLIKGGKHLADRQHELEKRVLELEMGAVDERLTALENHVLGSEGGPDPQPNISIRMAKLAMKQEELQRGFAYFKSYGTENAPPISRSAVLRMINKAFEGMPEWAALGTLHRRLIEGLEKL